MLPTASRNRAIRYGGVTLERFWQGQIPTMTREFRTERDSLGEIQVPSDALWGAQTQRAVENFRISARTMPRAFLRALGLMKQACATVNARLGHLDDDLATAIGRAAGAVASGDHDREFPVDVFQTGSGTSTNMNANEVIATLASQSIGRSVHPNDHVNMSQSSNDVIPSCIHLSALTQVSGVLLPAFDDLAETIQSRADENAGIVKTGRTHLMDAMPVRVDQELGAWAAQVRDARRRIHGVVPHLSRLAIGGTAVGTGVNAPADFGDRVVKELSTLTTLELTASDNRFRDMAGQDTAVELSGQLRGAAVVLTKIAGDLRWMNSGPVAGLGEISLPALQPGSSIMPGKVNPVIPEAVLMACARVMGHDASVAIAGQSGNFQLNVMLPLIADSLLDSIHLLTSASRALARQAIAGMEFNRERMDSLLGRNPILVTALNPVIGYDRAARIAKLAYASGRPVLDVAEEESDLDRVELEKLLDAARLTRPE